MNEQKTEDETQQEHEPAAHEQVLATDPYALTSEDDELYASEREYMLKRRNELADLFDKGRVALAGGAIAFSVGVVKDLLPNATQDTKTIIGWGWAILALSLVVSVICVYLASLSFSRQVDVLDDDRRVGNGEERLHEKKEEKRGKNWKPRKNGWNLWVDVMNVSSILSLALGLGVMGIALFGAFAEQPQKDTTTMSDKNTKKTTQQTTDHTKTLGATDRRVSGNQGGGSGNSGSSGGGKGGGKK